MGLTVPWPATATGCSPTPAGVISWWPGDGSANDLVSTNHGALQEGATATTPGLVGSAFSFDGTNHYVQIPDGPNLRPTNLTLEAWVRFSDLDSSSSGGVPAGQQFIVFKQNSRSSDFEGYDLHKTRSNGQDVFSFVVSSASGQSAEAITTTPINTGVWYHVAAVRDSNFLQLYVNGQLEGQAAASFAQDYGAFPLYFGTSGQTFWDAKFKGLLDEVTLYDRVLSADEIQALFAAGAAGKCKEPAITAQPQSQAVAAGSNATFSVLATGFGSLTYQWQLNGADLAGATASVLTLDNVTPEQAGNYTVVVTNALGTITSPAAILTVLTPPAITQAPSSLSVAAGSSATFFVAASGSPPLAYQWQVNGTNLAEATASVLTLENVTPEQAGDYMVSVSNLAGVAFSPLIVLTVRPFIHQTLLSDPNLNSAVAAALGKEPELLNQSDLSKLTSLTACGLHITNLSGLEYASNLTSLTLSVNGIEDLTPLSQLQALTQLALDRNRISNLAPLASLSQLTNLNLSDNLIGDGQALSSLTGLVSLSLNANSLSNLTFLRPLSQLHSLELGNNPFTRLTVLTNLTSLEELALSDNPLITNFNALSSLPHLTSLSLRDSSIRDLNVLQNLEQLRFLDLYNNPMLTDLSPLQRLRSLSHLDLSWNAGLTNCAVLAASTNLSELYLRGIGLSNVTFLQNLSRLSFLNLDTTQMSDPSPLAPLTNLNYLVLSGNPAITNFSVLSNLTALTNLELSRNSLSNLTFLSSLERLRYADLSFNHLTNLPPLTGLTNLNSLVLAGNPVTNLTQLSGMTTLTNLWLFDAGLSDAAFLNDCTWLRYVNLEGNLLTNLSPLAGLTNLTGLGLSRNPLATYDFLPGLTNLTSLRLDGNRLTDLAFLSNLTQLTFLSLNTNHLTDLSALAGLSQLQDLYLRRNWLREIEPLQQSPRLLSVDLSLNPLSFSTNTPSALSVVTNVQFEGVKATYLPLNQPPTLSTPNKWYLACNSTWSNAVVVLDDETPANQLVVTATSSNPELVSVLVSPLPGTNNDRTLTFSSYSQTMPAILALTVIDEAGLSTSTNLLVSVEPLTNVVISDPQLEIAIRTRLNQSASQLTTADLLALTDLPAVNHAITNLGGLEWALNLTTLSLENNAITNLTPLEKLPQLTFLSLNHNRLTDVSSLAGLTNCYFLSLQHNLLTNIASLPLQRPFSYLDIQLNLLDLETNSPALKTIERLTNQQVIVTYEPQREPPHLELHVGWAIRANTTSRLPFRAWDNGQVSAGLTITVASSNLNVVPTATVLPTREDGIWMLTATPGPGQTGSTTLTLTALNDAGLSSNLAIPVTVVQPQLLSAQALGSTTLTWAAWGHAPWQPQDGLAAVKTGTLTNNQEAWLETTVTGPGRLRYWWKVSSETNYDWLEFYVDERLQSNRISGEVTWQQQIVNLPGGNHTLHWRYAKDPETGSGLDAAWVGAISFLPGAVLELPGSPTNGWSHLLLYCAPDRLYDLQVSTNLAHWSRLELVQGSSKVLQRFDTNAAAPDRFYRLQPIWLEQAGLTTNGFHLLLHSPPDLRFELQTSTNLLDWNTLLTPTGAVRYIDGGASNTSYRFYRARLLPQPPEGSSP